VASRVGVSNFGILPSRSPETRWSAQVDPFRALCNSQSRATKRHGLPFENIFCAILGSTRLICDFPSTVALLCCWIFSVEGCNARSLDLLLRKKKPGILLSSLKHFVQLADPNALEPMTRIIANKFSHTYQVPRRSRRLTKHLQFERIFFVPLKRTWSWHRIA
jgi:hypothetical protein